MPVPIIDIQRRLTVVGKIRAGGEKGASRPGPKLHSWRLTSPAKPLIEQAAVLYGGDAKVWEGPNGTEWQVYTSESELPVLVLPGYSLRQTYEQWEGVTKRLRLCDGIDEELTGAACICNAEGVDKCDLYTRLVVALPELDSVLGWQVVTKGLAAGAELPGVMRLVEAMAGDRPFVPARLRLDHRRSVKDGQVVRFVVPTLDLTVGLSSLASPADGRELPSGGPVPAARREPTVEEALASVALPVPAPPRGGRRAAEWGPDPEMTWDGPLPEPGAGREQGAAPAAPAAQTSTETGQMNVRERLNTLVGRLRREGHITTESLYVAVARIRETTSDQVVEEVGGLDADGATVHWAPLRENLSVSEAMQLGSWLTEKARRVEAGEGAPTRSVGPTRDNPGDFPEGY